MSDTGPPYIGRSLLRREDRRLLMGQGQFVADLVLPRMLHAVLVRSPVAHARIRAVDLSRARAAPGVMAALNGADLLQLLPPVPEGQISLPKKWTTHVQHKFLNPRQPLLAHDKVRHVGEAVAIIVAEEQVRVIAPDVGGGFGGKGHAYPEDLLVPFLARRLGRPVRWIEERREHLISATHSRDQLHDVEIGFDDDGRILAIRDDYIVDCGAWNPIGSGGAYNTAVHLTGPYKIENLAASGKIAVTNKVPNAPYRGAGRPEAAFAMERAVDLVARTLGLEPAEVRRRNMIRADEMPYRVGIPYRDGEPIVYDSGDYPGALQKALDAIGGVEAFRRRQTEERGEGR